MTDILYIPAIGGACLAAVILLLLVSLCFHIRNADSIRIRFLKHSYKSVWLEAPGFCEIQHRNYIYSYQQSPLMASLIERKSVDTTVKMPFDGIDNSMKTITEDPSEGHEADVVVSIKDLDANPDEHTTAKPISAMGKSSHRSQPVLHRPTISFDEEDFNSSYAAESLNPIRPYSFSASTEDTNLVMPKVKPSAKRVKHMLVQQNDAESDIAYCDGSMEIEDPPDVETGPVADGATSSALFGLHTTEQSSLTSSQQRIQSVLHDFYSAVKSMNLENVEASDERLQKLADSYGEQYSTIIRGRDPRFYSINEGPERKALLSRKQIDATPKASVARSSSRLRDCVQQSRKSSGKFNRQSNQSFSSEHSATLEPGSAAGAPKSESGSADRASINVGHTSGLRRLLFASSPGRSRLGGRAGQPQSSATRLAPRLSPSQSSM